MHVSHARWHRLGIGGSSRGPIAWGLIEDPAVDEAAASVVGLPNSARPRPSHGWREGWLHARTVVAAHARKASAHLAVARMPPWGGPGLGVLPGVVWRLSWAEAPPRTETPFPPLEPVPG